MMTSTLKVYDGTTEVNFLTGSLQLQAGGWSTKDASGDGLVWETISLVASDSDADIRSAKINLDILGARARAYQSDKILHDAVWMYWNSDGENERRALVYDITSEIQGDEIFGVPLLGIGVALLRVAIQRKAEYEDSSPVTIDLGTVDGHGGAVPLPDIGCSLNGRIAQVIFSGASSQDVTKVWLGLRPTYEGSVGFQALWEAGVGTLLGNTVTGSNSFASNGVAVAIPFTDYNDLSLPRLTLRMDQAIGGNYNSHCGKYLLLGVLNVGAMSTECRVQIRHGYGTAAHNSVLTDTFVGGTAEDMKWRLRELGVIDIPPMGNRDKVATDGGFVQAYMISVYAERLSPAGTLYLDCFILVPASHLVTMDMVMDAGDGDIVVGYTAPNDEMYAINERPASVDSSFQNWEYPSGGGLAVLAIDYPNTSLEPDWTETVDVSLVVYPRWTSYNDGTPYGT